MVTLNTALRPVNSILIKLYNISDFCINAYYFEENNSEMLYISTLKLAIE